MNAFLPADILIPKTDSMDELEKAAQAAGFSRGEISLITESSDGFVLKFKSLELLQKLKNALLGS